MLEILLLICLVLTVTFLIIVVFNYNKAPVMIEKETGEEERKISVLIPARNESENIGACLEKLKVQKYKNIEIIVLDDESEDDTAEIVKKAAEDDDRIKLVEGKPLPEGWLGKNWACHQLQQEAASDLMLFVDADVEPESGTVGSALKTFDIYKLNFLSVFPTQIIKTFGEHLIVPLMNWLLLTFLPLRKVYTSRKISFAAANGQFILIDRNTYNKIGGHEAVKHEVVEDMELVRNVKREGLKAMTLLGGDLIKCRMYKDYYGAFNGFTKNFYPGFKMNPIVFSLLLLFILFVFLFPVVGMIFSRLYFLPVVVIAISRMFVAALSKQNAVYSVLLHPVQMIYVVAIGINSIITYEGKGIEWKGRKTGE